MGLHRKKPWFNATIIGLKLCALAMVLEAVLVHYASRVAMVIMATTPGMISQANHQPILTSYTYYSSVRYLNLADLKWALIVGAAIYAEALLIETVVGRKPSPVLPTESHQIV